MPARGAFPFLPSLPLCVSLPQIPLAYPSLLSGRALHILSSSLIWCFIPLSLPLSSLAHVIVLHGFHYYIFKRFDNGAETFPLNFSRFIFKDSHFSSVSLLHYLSQLSISHYLFLCCNDNSSSFPKLGPPPLYISVLFMLNSFSIFISFILLDL